MSNMVPVVSVVMPVYRPKLEHLREAVGSVLDQSCEDWELIIVEDPSPDNGAKVVAEFGDSRIRHFSNASRTSLVDQLNAGLKRARADLVARFDADDICDEHRLQSQLDYMRLHPEIDVLGSQLAIIDDAGRPRGWRHYLVDDAAIKKAMPFFNPMAHPSVMYRRSVILRAGGYRYRRYPANEDYELWSRLAHSGACFANHPDALVRYRVHPRGLKAAKLRGIIRGTQEVKQIHWADVMTWRGRLRMLLERALLHLPPHLVLTLFMWTQCQSCPPRPRTV